MLHKLLAEADTVQRLQNWLGESALHDREMPIPAGRR